jgi:hypothetical protein
MIYDNNKGISYINGFKPIFGKNNSNDFVMLTIPNKNTIINITLNVNDYLSTKDKCLKSMRCAYRETIIFGKPAYNMVVLDVPNLQFIDIPDLKIRIMSNLISDDVLNQINISKIHMDSQ